ncbi:MAG: desulfoferrodoxin family protein [Candidatus Aenigmatarchaeota archaeon]
MGISNIIQSADWSKEKHVPVIEVKSKTDLIEIEVSVGKQIPHPNTTEHHIRFIEVYFLADGEKFAYQLGRFEFGAHQESTQGPNTSTIFTEPKVNLFFKTSKSGTIFALAYCNIHGLWENQLKLEL